MIFVMLFFFVMSASSGILCKVKIENYWEGTISIEVSDGVEGEHTSGTVGTGRLDQGIMILKKDCYLDFSIFL